VNATALAEALSRLAACGDAREWAEGKTLATAWRTCPRGDWMLWLAGRAEVRRQVLVLAACACARLSLKHVEKGEKRPLRAIEAAEDWARGGATTLKQVKDAAAAAAADAASAASAAAAASARTKTLKKCATLVRKRIPLSMIKAAMEDK
jgi:hypothetical protein